MYVYNSHIFKIIRKSLIWSVMVPCKSCLKALQTECQRNLYQEQIQNARQSTEGVVLSWELGLWTLRENEAFTSGEWDGGEREEDSNTKTRESQQENQNTD